MFDRRNIIHLLLVFIEKEDAIMASLADLQAAVAAQDEAIDKAIAMIAALSVPSTDQALIDALTVALSTKTAALDAVVTPAPVEPAPAA